MNIEEGLQIIGILFMAIGSVLAIEGLWRNRIKKSIHEKRKIAEKFQEIQDKGDVSLADFFKELPEDFIEKFGIGKNLTKRDKELLSVAYVFYIGFDGFNAMEKLKFLTFIDKYLVLIGMICIVFGAIVQIIGLLQ